MVTVIAAANTETKQRTATITVYGTGVTQQTINITVDAAAPSDPTISMYPALLNFTASGGQGNFTIKSNTNWNVVSSDSTWIKLSPISGSNDSTTVIVTTIANPDTIQRTATITAYGTGVAPQTINVTQTLLMFSNGTQTGSTDGIGTISLNQSIPSNTTLTGSFKITFPAGIALRESSTVLSPELSGNFYPVFTDEGNNTWLIEIKSMALNSFTAPKHTNIMAIGYTVADSVSKGTYDALIKNIDFLQDNGTSIKEDLLTASINVTTPTSIDNIGNTLFRAHFINKMLKIESSQAEMITIYSAAGVRLYSTKKNVGTIEIPGSSIPCSVFIVKGSVSGTIKVVK